MFTWFISVPITAAWTSCGNIAPLAVATGLPNPAALIPTTTIDSLKSSGRSVTLALLLCWLQSIHMRPQLSVVIGPNLGIRIFSTPLGASLTWNVVSPAATRRTSMLRLGNSLPLLAMMRGILRATPSTSGSVTTLPMPMAFSSSWGMFAIIPGQFIIWSIYSGLRIAAPGLRAVFLSLALGMLVRMIGLSAITFASASSPLNLSCSGIMTFHTTRPALRL